MLVQIYTIISLLVLTILILRGSGIESAILKSASVFVFLVVGTRISVHLLEIIRDQSQNEQESPSHN